MSGKRLSLAGGRVALMLAVLPLLAACNLGGGLPVCDPAAINLGGIYPTYAAPAEPYVSPMIEWRYYIEADGSDAGCDPESQHIRFGTRSFDEAGRVALTTLVERDLAGTDRLYTPGIRLEPAGHYFWEVTWFGASGTLQNSRVIAFNAGPICEREALLPPVILSVPDGAAVAVGAILSWEFPGSCIPDGIELDMGTSSAFERSATDFWYYDRAYRGAVVGGEPCQVYYWRVASSLNIPPADMEFGPAPDFPSPIAGAPLEFEFHGLLYSDYAPARSFYLMGEACAVPPEGFTPVGSLLDAPELPVARLRVNANCRSGPTMEYPVLHLLPAGAELPIQGRNPQGDSWLVQDDAIQRTCWVFSENVEVLGNIDAVAIINPDPPPTATPEPQPLACRDYSNQNSCEKAGCTWDPKYQPNGRCQ